MTTALTRRHLLAAALATGVAVPLGAGRGWAAPAPGAPGPARLTSRCSFVLYGLTRC
ncbi:hypothetical protein GCM10022225_73100 [Plantactinospora mayteni]|uniref:Twin-arginine translocation signal domain-containing protein n=1 Tax=Plantactinospora mayteni TaxID=566021 RepID=A0ABQ4F1I3_9ACTN|nr:hypothetical protein [Plantactinospora mayteni]GIH00765.1 hypothetical protein Pma05_73370 [Plantactinospora mayteni]